MMKLKEKVTLPELGNKNPQTGTKSWMNPDGDLRGVSSFVLNFRLLLSNLEENRRDISKSLLKASAAYISKDKGLEKFEK